MYSELVQHLGAANAALVWAHYVDGWALGTLAAALGTTKQVLWHRLQPVRRRLQVLYGEAA